MSGYIDIELENGNIFVYARRGSQEKVYKNSKLLCSVDIAPNGIKTITRYGKSGIKKEKRSPSGAIISAFIIFKNGNITSSRLKNNKQYLFKIKGNTTESTVFYNPHEYEEKIWKDRVLISYKCITLKYSKFLKMRGSKILHKRIVYNSNMNVETIDYVNQNHIKYNTNYSLTLIYANHRLLSKTFKSYKHGNWYKCTYTTLRKYIINTI